MLQMTAVSKTFLQKNLPELLLYNDVDEVLLALDAFITREGLDNDDNMTPFGREAQSVFDDIYANN